MELDENEAITALSILCDYRKFFYIETLYTVQRDIVYNTAPGVWFITKIISSAQVVPGTV